MTSETRRAKSKLATLAASLDVLESQLEPLFAQTLPDTALALEPIQQAKLHTLLPYLVYDLIFIYLKTRGINPKTHPVVPELDRVRQYFQKISAAEHPPTKRTEVDKDAAGRFIKHAIAQVKWTPTAAERAQQELLHEDHGEVDTLSQTQKYPDAGGKGKAKVTSKMLAREAYQRRLCEEEEDEDGLSGVDSVESAGEAADAFEMEPSASIPENHRPTTDSIPKHCRPALDPFAGYGNADTLSAMPESVAPSDNVAAGKRSLLARKNTNKFFSI